MYIFYKHSAFCLLIRKDWREVRAALSFLFHLCHHFQCKRLVAQQRLTEVKTVLLSFLGCLREALGFPAGTNDKEPTCQCRDVRKKGSIHGSGRFPGGGHGNPLQYSCLENPTDRGAWRAIVHRVTKSRTQWSDLAQHKAPLAFFWVPRKFQFERKACLLRADSVHFTPIPPTAKEKGSPPGYLVSHWLSQVHQNFVHKLLHANEVGGDSGHMRAWEPMFWRMLCGPRVFLEALVLALKWSGSLISVGLDPAAWSLASCSLLQDLISPLQMRTGSTTL